MKSYRGKRSALLGMAWLIGGLPLASAHAYQVVVSPTSGLVTDEGGASDSFTMVLDTAPNHEVTMTVSSSNPAEGTASPGHLTFTPENWDQPQTVTVTGVGDSLGDGDRDYVIFTRETVSEDPRFNGLDPDDVAVTNLDTTHHFLVSAISGETSEAGGTANFTVVLGVPPAADVTIPLSSSNESEGLLSPTELTFTPSDWSVPRTVTVTGVDDGVQDGDQSYTVQLGAVTSADPAFSGRDPDDVAVVNRDTTQLRVVTSTISGATTEAGGEASFTVVLTVPPTASVTIPLSSSNVEEGMVTVDSVIFTPGNWDVPQTVTVVGVSDAVADGDQSYRIILGAAVSDDPDYSGVDVNDVTVVNAEQARSSVIVSPISGATDEGGGRATFTVALSRQPSADVVVSVSSSDPGEGTVSPSRLTFSSVNWESPQTVTVTGALDLVEDGDQAYIVEFGAVVSADAAFDGQVLSGVAVINHDRTVVADRLIGSEERLDGLLLRGTIINYGVLNDVRVLGGGVVDGGTLSGSVTNSGTIRNVTLAAGCRVEGGTIGGTVSGAEGAGGDLPVIEGEVEEGAALSYVTLGEGATLGEGVTLGRGVRFAANDLIPEGADLAPLLEPLGGGEPYADPVADLSSDVVARGASGSDPILFSLNALPGIADSGRLLTQDQESGALILDGVEGHFVVRPTGVVQAGAGTPAGVSVDAEGVYRAVTADGREVTLEPALEAPADFVEAIAALWPESPVAGRGGILTVTLDETRWLAMRPSLLVTAADDTLAPGVEEEEHPEDGGSTALVHRFRDSAGGVWEQRLFPVAAVDGMAGAIVGLPAIDRVEIDEQGVVRARAVTGQTLRGVLDFPVSAGEPTVSGGVEFEVAGDIDGDGIDDFTIIGGDGVRQWLRILP